MSNKYLILESIWQIWWDMINYSNINRIPTREISCEDLTIGCQWENRVPDDVLVHFFFVEGHQRWSNTTSLSHLTKISAQKKLIRIFTNKKSRLRGLGHRRKNPKTVKSAAQFWLFRWQFKSLDDLDVPEKASAPQASGGEMRNVVKSVSVAFWHVFDKPNRDTGYLSRGSECFYETKKIRWPFKKIK